MKTSSDSTRSSPGAGHVNVARVGSDSPFQSSMARVDSLQAVCTRHLVPLAAAALQFPLAHPAVVSVIPGMSSAAEVAAAARWMSIPIPAACWHELRQQGLLHADAPIPVAA